MKKVLFLLLIIFSFAIRFYNLDKVPISLFSDEVDLGYQSYSFLKTGGDYYGNKLPVSFHSFADYRASFYIYSAATTIVLFGLNEWGVRLPAVIFGVLGVIAFFFLILKISKNYWFSLLSAFILSILPWHIHYSRAGFEVTALFFLLCVGLFFFYRYLERKLFSNLLICLLSLGLCFYTYATARLFLPLLALAAIFIYRKEIFDKNWRKVLFAGLICLIVLLPFCKDTFFGGGLHRFSYLNIFSDSNLKYEVNRQRLVDATHEKMQVVGMKTPLIAYIFHNKPFSWFLTIVNNYSSGFSTEFLFVKGDSNLRHGIGKMGVLLFTLFPFLILGFSQIFYLLKEKEKGILPAREALFLLVFLLISPLPASITTDGGSHATRLFFLVLPMAVFISLGIWTFKEWFKNKKFKVPVYFFVFAMIFLNFIYYFHLYFYHYPADSEKYWDYGYKQAAMAIVQKEKDYDKIFMSTTVDPQIIFFLFWSKKDPLIFNIKNLNNVSSDWFDGKQIEKYYFGKVGSGFMEKYSNQNLNENGKILILAKRGDFGGDLEKEIPHNFKLIEKITFSDNEPIFYLLTN